MDVRGHLDLLLLAVLADAGPVHGYAVITALRDRSDGAFDVPEGTVYPALHRLERAGLVVSRWEQAAPRRRRVYELTREGREARVAKQSEWRRFVDGVQAVLGPAATQVPA
ncbi:helix-turn-helix transcriptional regulator [Actinoplanes solisilvae]|uniref:helix-turn-helix transcriptional regulator n=1 Tax=Actinoplanes solisilvae TaxID=2486853 RepID=UPI000FD8F698|nr:helix-turn-helix transcriptional regulator [Actinoplanes solisilvae]